MVPSTRAWSRVAQLGFLDLYLHPHPGQLGFGEPFCSLILVPRVLGPELMVRRMAWMKDDMCQLARNLFLQEAGLFPIALLEPAEKIFARAL